LPPGGLSGLGWGWHPRTARLSTYQLPLTTYHLLRNRRSHCYFTPCRCEVDFWFDGRKVCASVQILHTGIHNCLLLASSHLLLTSDRLPLNSYLLSLTGYQVTDIAISRTTSVSSALGVKFTMASSGKATRNCALWDEAGLAQRRLVAQEMSVEQVALHIHIYTYTHIHIYTCMQMHTCIKLLTDLLARWTQL
jgi:hypothetical protein